MKSGVPAWLKVPRNRRILAGVLLLLAAAAAYLFGVRGDMTDFGVCRQAGGRVLSGETLYRASDGHLQFKYAPAAALFFSPFSVLPPEAGKVAWFAVLAACLAGVLAVVSRWAGPGRSRLGPLLWTVAVSAKFLGREMELGQVNLLLLLLMVLSIREQEAGREGSAGIVWGFSLLFKPYAAVLLPYFILKGKGRTIAAGAATIIAGLLVPVLVFGWRGNAVVLGEWVSTLRASTPGLLRVGDNASLFAFLAKNLGLDSDLPALAAGGAIAVVLGVLVLAMILKGKKDRMPGAAYAEAAALLVLIPMLSPLGWNYNYLYGLPAIYLLLAVRPRFGPAGRAVLVLNFFLIGGTLREVLGKTLFRAYTGRALVVPSFLILFGLLAEARRRRFL